ncbi:Inositol-pentakisphosphate 2-kinase 1, putative isoform 2 [Theobroma cacao]|uniref:Inositol-pentakisphosphate 2-kinase n=1 Tax=Theobroma cacao TaxID=3641 RepID=A0A061FDP4_THECC|nr:Inositol-pentakisphosphate 2-kinase 1, putative isoform 2 [Theobroma cacao]
MEKVVLEQKDAVDWVYRGEGAANLVLAYTGSSPAFIGKVMRIQKSPRNDKNGVNGNGSLTTQEQLLWREDMELTASPNREIVEQLYVKHAMSPLLGPKHVDAGIRVRVTKEFLESVDNNVICQRPAWRVDSSQVDANRDTALIISDHSVFPNGTLKGGPCVTVEIKPKCGFLPISRFIAEENALKRIITRFRMHQALKLHKQEISEYSEYNPLDLFSGSRDRICKAIKALYATPQNNFRVFLNGSRVFGGSGGGTDNTTVLVVCRELSNDKLSHQYTSLHSIPLDESLKIVKDYLMAATAKDCSLMISFRPKEDGELQSGSSKNSVYLGSTNQVFEYKVYFIDLDLKPLKKMEYYYKLDKKIVSCYSQKVKTEHRADKAVRMDSYGSVSR